MLTKEQRLLAEENHNLIYTFLNNNNYFPEEYYDIAAIGYCEAAASFDSTKGFAFATYAFKCMKNEVYKHMKAQTMGKRSMCYTVSMETPVFDGLKIGDAFEDASNNVESHALASEVMNIINNLPEKMKKTMTLLIDGYGQGEIAEIVGISQCHVSRLQNKARQIIVRKTSK